MFPLKIDLSTPVTQDFWTFCLTRLQGELPPQQFSTWIKALRVEDGDADTTPSVRIVAPNRFVLQWVRERYVNRIGELGKEFYGATMSVDLSLPVNGEATRSARSGAAVRAAAEVKPVSPAPVAEKAPEPAKPPEPARRPPTGGGTGYDKTRLNADFTFDTLVTGRANDLARAAAMQVADNPGVSYNPLFVYGGVGLGKTHLIHALGNEVHRRNPKAVIRYVHAEDYPDTSRWLGDFPNLVVTRTFSKAYGLAALRVGYGLSHPDVADLLNRVRQPFNVDSFAQAGALAALADRDYLRRSVELNTRGMQQLATGVTALGLGYIPSSGNFLTIDLGREAHRSPVLVRPARHGANPNSSIEQAMAIEIGQQQAIEGCTVRRRPRTTQIAAEVTR